MLVVEGVMGMFDGAADGTPSSTADVARILVAPVLLVVDAEAMAGSVAAVVHGFATLDPAVDLAGVVLNRVASDGHEAMLREAIAPTGVPVVGALRRDDRLVWRDRHLGLSRSPRIPRPWSVPSRRWPPPSPSASTSAPWPRWRRRPHGCRSIRSPCPPPAGRPHRGRRRAGVHVHVHRHARCAPCRKRRDRGVRPPGRRRLQDPVDGLVVGGGFPEVHAARLAGQRAAPRRGPACRRRGGAHLGRMRWPALAHEVRRRAADGRHRARHRAHDRPAHARLPRGHRHRHQPTRPRGDPPARPRVPLRLGRPAGRCPRSPQPLRPGTGGLRRAPWRRSSITTPGAIPRRSPRSWRRAGLHADGRFKASCASGTAGRG